MPSVMIEQAVAPGPGVPGIITAEILAAPTGA